MQFKNIGFRVPSNRSLGIIAAIVIIAVCVAVMISLVPSKASANIFDQLLYNTCHDHVDNNGGNGIDLLDPICAHVENEAPEGFNQALVTDEGVAVSTTLTGSDPDNANGFLGDILYFSISMLPAHGTLSCSGSPCNTLNAFVGSTAPGGQTPEVTYTPELGFTGDDEYDFTANDGLLEITNSDATVTIHVNAVVTPPVDPTCNENQTLVNHLCVDNVPPPADEDDNDTPAPQTVWHPQCSDGIDNDNDGRTDYQSDASCFDASDNSEGEDGAFFGGSGGGGGNGGGGSGNAPSGGLVLGASTSIPACSNPLLTSFLRIGRKNDVEQVKKLQEFLNLHMSAALEVSGIFDTATEDAVKAFQLKYDADILKPWKPFGLKDGQATGYVFKTTQRMINMLSCSNLIIPAPQLP